jgi:hypothetical protein
MMDLVKIVSKPAVVVLFVEVTVIAVLMWWNFGCIGRLEICMKPWFKMWSSIFELFKRRV